MDMLSASALGLLQAHGLDEYLDHLLEAALHFIGDGSLILYRCCPYNPGAPLQLIRQAGKALDSESITDTGRLLGRLTGEKEPLILQGKDLLRAGILKADLVVSMPDLDFSFNVVVCSGLRRPLSEEEISFLKMVTALISVAVHHFQIIQSERDQRQYAEALRDSAEALTSTLSIDEVLDRILRDIEAVAPHDAAHVMLLDNDVARIVRCRGYLDEEKLKMRRFTVSEIPHLQVLFDDGQPVAISDTCTSPAWTNIPEVSWIRSYAGAPIRIKKNILGFLGIDSGTPNFFTSQEARSLQAFADQAAIALDNARLYAEVQHLAMTDELTGLLNRRGLQEEAAREIERCQRYGRPLAAMLVDIDNLKEINDQFGHMVGDEVIKWVADHIRRHIRNVDQVARIGGDEIFLLLPETSLEQAHELAERVRSSMGKLPLLAGTGNISVTLSIGLYGMSSEPENLYSLLNKSDRALYRAKGAGRNRVELFN